jgi:integrase
MVPTFPPIAVPEYVPRIISIEEQRRILDAIPWDRRGAFLAAATEALRVSEVRALSLDDWDGKHLVIARAVQGRKVDAPIKHTKNRSSVRREPWDEEFRRWLDWRLEQATPATRLRGEVALCWNPDADNRAKRWSVPTLRRAWHLACDAAAVARVSFQQGTRHATITALAQVLPERVLRDFTRHRDPASLSHYAKPTAAPEAIVRVLRPGRSTYR